MKTAPLIFTIIIFLNFLYGCGSSVQTVEVLLHCDDDCNENHAVVVTVFQLKNADKFEHASLESLLRDPEGILAAELIPETKYEKTMIPGEDFHLDNFEIKAEAKFFGIIGDFNSPAKDGWMQIVPIDSDTEGLNILVHKNFLSAVKKD
jgi:type VI secretion system VasD/TssJ family lipoprotein